MEIWKDLDGFPNYIINNKGVIVNKKTSKIRKPYLNNKGYKCIDLYKDNKRSKFLMHRLLALHFLEKVEGKSLINHKDGNPLNNELDNLEWCNASENSRHAYDNGLHSKDGIERTLKAMRDACEKRVRCINDGKVYKSVTEASISIGRAKSTVSNHLKGNTKSAGKDKDGNPLYWEYV